VRARVSFLLPVRDEAPFLAEASPWPRLSAVEGEAAARRWVEGWLRAWSAGDADAVAELYAEDAIFVSHPFREPHLGAKGARDYALQSFGEEELVECRFGEPVVAGDRATCEYWALMRVERKETTLAGVALIRFGPDGRVVEQRDYWSMTEGSRRPAPGLGHLSGLLGARQLAREAAASYRAPGACAGALA
jgi:ketosteroid isomerase-like protein